MKWGRKKTSFPSSSYSSSPSPPCSRPSSLIAHVFPVSWISKFKHKSGNSEPKPRKGNPKGKRKSPPLFNSPRCTNSSTTLFMGDHVNGNGNGTFHGLEADDDAFWRLSFGQDTAEEKKKRAGVKSVWYNSDDELGIPVSICPNCRRKEAQKLNGFHKCKGDKERDLRSPTSSRSAQARKLARNVEKEERAFETRRKCRYVSPVGVKIPGLKTIKEEGLNLENGEERLEESTGFDWKLLKELKVEEVKSRNEKQRKSLYLSREEQRKGKKQMNKVRAYSPRTASRIEICKVKDLEDMKKAKLKMKKKKKEEEEEEADAEARTVQQSKTRLDSFAVVKCSYDPQQDFKDSMVEMIVEKKMSQPEELEELLACFLSLNSDEYHDMIIKVFRQVWFEMDQSCFSSEFTK